jgi:hypothetical protein
MFILGLILICACLGCAKAISDILDDLDTKKELERTEFPNEEDE